MTKKDLAGKFFLEGFNCSQSVFTAFADRFGLDEETAKKISAGLGGGVGRQREVCGAVSGAAMVIGSISAATEGNDNENKKRNYELVREFSNRFTEIHGTIICRELLKLSAEKKETAVPDDRTADYYKDRPCLKIVEDAAAILEEMMKESGC